MKNKIWSTIAIAAAMLCSSCENNFDPNLYGTLNPENFPSNEAEYTSYMMTCYMPFMTVWTYDMNAGGVQHGWYIPAGGVIRMFDCPSDFMAVGNLNEEGWAYFTRGQFAPAVYYWRGQVQDVHNVNHFPKTTQITRFTEIIGTLENAPADRLNEATKMSLLGEARLCRGVMLYYLLHTFGPVPVVIDPDKVLDPEALSNTTRPSLDQMCKWIEDDFEFAVAHAPETAPVVGRYTSDYARFCLMRHCLNEGDHMPGYYDRGIELYNELNTGKYRLYTEGDNPYKSVFSYHNKFNCEIIEAVSCNDGADGYPQHGNFFPFLALALPWNVAKEDPFPTETRWLQAYSMNVNYYDAFEPNDQRRDCILTSYKANNGTTYSRSHIGSQWNGFIVNKWPHECEAQFQSQDVPLARWADVLLMYAELLTQEQQCERRGCRRSRRRPQTRRPRRCERT